MKKVLRLAHELGYSLRQIAESVRLGRTSVQDYLARADAAGVRYEDVADTGEAEIEALLCRRPEPAVTRPSRTGPRLRWSWPSRRLRCCWFGRNTGTGTRRVTATASSAGITQPSEAGAEPRMRRTLLPAQLCEVDYAGMVMTVITSHGERQASLFVGTLPFSTHLHAEATWTQASEDADMCRGTYPHSGHLFVFRGRRGDLIKGYLA